MASIPNDAHLSMNIFTVNGVQYGQHQQRRLSKNQDHNLRHFVANLSQRLVQQKRLLKHLTILSDIMCILAVLGIVLMIIENELNFKNIDYDDQDTIATWFIKLTITISTAILIVTILLYHRIELSLYSINHSLEDWRVGLSWNKIFLIVVEVLICIVHPIPRSYPSDEQESVKTPSTDAYPLSHVNIDVALGLPMFARLYLLCRPILYHSDLMHNTISNSIGYLNTVSINVGFILRAYLKLWPTASLLVWSTVMFFVGSWSIRACDYKPTHKHIPLSDAMWLFTTVFSSVGYSTVLPSTHCTRVVCASICLLGLLTVSCIIAVITQQLQLSRSENYLHSFVLNTDMSREHKHQSANIIKFAMKLWLRKGKQSPLSTMQHLQIQRMLFRSIGIIQRIRNEQRYLPDNTDDLSTVMSTQQSTNFNINKSKEKMKKLASKMSNIQVLLANLDQTLHDPQDVLHFSF